MLKIIKSRKIKHGQLKFNSQWEFFIYKKIKKLLPKQYYPIEINQRISGFRFELDIYIPKLKLAFELQGPLHFQYLNIIYRDLLKANICKNIGIDIIYLFYNKSYNNNFFRKKILTNLYKYETNTSGAHITKMEFESDNASEHSLILSDSSEKSAKKPKKVSTKQNYENLRLHKEKMQEHYNYIQSIKTEIYQPISIAIKAFKEQCPDINIRDSSIKRHIIKQYKDILNCLKLNNRWMCSCERVKEIQFDVSRYKKKF